MSSQDTGPSGSEDSGDPVDKHIVQKAIKRRASLLGDDSRPGGSKRRRDASEEGELAASDPRRSGAIDLLSDTPSSSDASGSQHSDFHQADSATSSGSRQQDCIQPRRAALPPPVGVTVVEDDAATQSNEAQRLLRIPRYFHPDFKEAGVRCFKCGGIGHISRDCTNQPKERPCYQCAQLGHTRDRCPNALCFTCKQPGHMARDCPYGRTADEQKPVCLQCGEPDCPAAGKGDYVRAEGGCANQYRKSDLRLVRCFVCHKMGHLCCADAPTQPPKLSCYNCGEGGHSGEECYAERPAVVDNERRGGRQGRAEVYWGYEEAAAATSRGRWGDAFSPPGRQSYYAQQYAAADGQGGRYGRYEESRRVNGGYAQATSSYQYSQRTVRYSR